MKPSPGSSAPDFTAPVAGSPHQDGESISLAALRGETVVLIFYPKDNTPGCTLQACAVRDGWDDLKTRARIFGVSPDSVKSHRKFIDKHGLPYPLIADADHRIAEAYGVWVEKSMMGRKYLGVERSTFIIDPDGTVRTILEKVSPPTHLDQLREALA